MAKLDTHLFSNLRANPQHPVFTRFKEKSQGRLSPYRESRDATIPQLGSGRIAETADLKRGWPLETAGFFIPLAVAGFAFSQCYNIV